MFVLNILWFLTIMACGLAAGLMTGHWLLLGRYLTWLFRTGREDVFRSTYPEFLQSNPAVAGFDHVFTVAVILAHAYAGTSWALSGRPSAGPIAAVVLQWVFLGHFFGAGFAGLEKRLFSGDVSAEAVSTFSSRNMPYLFLYAALWLAVFAILTLSTV